MVVRSAFARLVVVLLVCAAAGSVLLLMMPGRGRARPATIRPEAPANLAVTADDGAAYLSWSPPNIDGGGTIDSYRVTDDAGQTVIAPCGRCTSMYFSGLVNGITYTFTVAAHNSAGYSPAPAISSGVTPKAPSELQDSAPQSVTAVANGQSATVTWQPPAITHGLPIDRFMIQIDDLSLTNAPGAVYYSGWQYACATCTSTTVSGLTAGDTYSFLVYAHNQSTYDTYSRAGSSNSIVATDPSCDKGRVCLSVDGQSNQGPIQWRADGFLGESNFTQSSSGGTTTFSYAGPNASLIEALHPTSWRLSSCVTPLAAFPQCQWVASNTSASLTDVLSLDYYDETYSPQTGGMTPPWECWSCYESDIRGIVTNVGPRDIAPPQFDQPEPAASLYWDVQNEPGDGPDELGPHQDGTTPLYLQEFRKAYQTIQAIDPSTQVVLPSMSDFIDTPIGVSGLNDPHTLGFDSVIPFLVSNRMNVSALSWHANSGLFADSPTVLPYQVAELKYLESEYGMAATPKTFINEYDPKFANLLPGWSAGWIAALEDAKVDQANRACWPEHAGVSEQGRIYTECDGGSAGGLFTSSYDTSSAINGLSDRPLQPDANYWVYRFYAAMTGTVLSTVTSDNTVTALATKNDSNQTVDILVGRHKSCTPTVNTDCTIQQAPEVAAIPTPSVAPVSIAIRYPYAATSVTASIADVPNRRGPVAQPAAQPEVLPVTDGTVTVSLPAVADGDAYTISLTPDA